MANRQKTFDALCEMHGIGVVAVSTAATAGFDTGGGYTEGKLVIDVTAVSTLSSLDQFEILLQGSPTSTFTTWDTLTTLHLGWMYSAIADRMGGDPGTVVRSSTATYPGPTTLPVRFVIPFCNDYAGTVYRWLRMYTCMGTPSTGINYYAFLTV